MKIAVITDKNENILPFYSSGIVELYTCTEDNIWNRTKKIPFEIQDTLNMNEVRSLVIAMIDEMEDCNCLVVETIRGFPRSVLEDKGFSIWNSKGILSIALLNQIKEQSAKLKQEQLQVISTPTAIDNIGEGIYRVNLAGVLQSSPAHTSKKILIPFFQNTSFEKIEIICDHLPKWFDKEFEARNLRFQVEEVTDDGLYHVAVFPGKAMSSVNAVKDKTADVLEDIKNITAVNHPCFNVKARHTYARVHLPVAPKCNIQCNYCNRKYDCVNESRPGVTSAVLLPFQAVEYLKEIEKHIENLSVIGIAGPGDPFANPDETIQTMRLSKQTFPEKIFCLSTNGLNLKPYINEIAELGVTHVTITINAVDPEIISKIYSWIKYEKRVYRGMEAAKIILKEQLDCIPLLKQKNITVKINCVILPGVNDHHIEEVAKKVAELGADVMNCIPVVPNKETVFSDMEKPSSATMSLIRAQAKEHIDLMTHCARCRADAAGLLGHDFAGAFGLLQEFALRPLVSIEDRPYTAVATYEGMLVNAHLGDADTLYIFKETPNGYQFVEERETPEPGCGDNRWRKMGDLLKDCRALLVSGVGTNPLKIIQSSGIRIIQMTGLIDEGLDAVYKGKIVKAIKKPEAFKCGDGGCQGNARGCA